MLNKQKDELRRIIKSIPNDRLNISSIKTLWKRYYPEVSYSTFRQYLRIFKIEKIKKANTIMVG